MTPELTAILRDLGVQVIPTTAYRAAGQTCAVATLGKLLEEFGEEHVTLVVRSIAESGDNAGELVAPVILAVSDIVLAHPEWPARGLAWLEALDGVDLKDIADLARENRRAVKLRAGIAALLHVHLRNRFNTDEQRPAAKSRALAEARVAA